MSFLEKIGFHKSSEVAPQEISAEPEQIKTASAEKEQNFSALPTIEDFRAILEDNKNISVEEIEGLFGVSPEEFMKTITGDENIKIPDIQAFHEAIKKAQTAEQEEYRDSGLRKLANNNFFKAGVLSLILFLKFAPHAEAAHTAKPETGDKKFNTELANKSETKIDGGDDKTFHLDSSNPGEAPAIEKLAKLDLTNSYETDKADILEDQRAAIEAQVHKFLDGITAENYRDLMTHDWKISGSSDERLTSAWEGGNAELTQARIDAAEQIIQEAIDNYDYSHSGLSSSQIDDLKNKNFIHDAYESKNGPEKGVTYLTDLQNPETGKNFTPKEIKDIKEHDEKKYYSLLEKCRYIKVNLMAEGETIKPVPNKPAELKIDKNVELLKRSIPEFGQYKSVLILEDNSGSMTVSKEAMAQYLINNYQDNIKVTIATFSNRLDNFSQPQDMNTAGETLKQTRNVGNSSERTIACTIDALKLFEVQDNSEGLALIGTDEALQGVSFNDLKTLQALANEKHVDVKFLIVHDEHGSRVTEKVSLETIINNFTDPHGMYQKTKKNLERYANNTRISKSSQKAFQERLKNIDDNGFTMKSLTIEDSDGGTKEIELALY